MNAYGATVQYYWRGKKPNHLREKLAQMPLRRSPSVAGGWKHLEELCKISAGEENRITCVKNLPGCHCVDHRQWRVDECIWSNCAKLLKGEKPNHLREKLAQMPLRRSPSVTNEWMHLEQLCKISDGGKNRITCVKNLPGCHCVDHRQWRMNEWMHMEQLCNITDWGGGENPNHLQEKLVRMPLHRS